MTHIQVSQVGEVPRTQIAPMATAAVSACTLFNRKLIDFIADLKPIIGHVSEYSVVSASAKLMSQLDERKNQQFFDQYVAGPYEAKIAARDSAFFMAEDYDGVDDLGLVQLLKRTWSSLSPDDQVAVWDHLQVLLVLNRRCKQEY
jgi:hypothetical protein